MHDVNEHAITDVVIDSFRNTPDPRLRRIVTSLVTHLHRFVRDVDLSPDEWSYAIDFLTRTGHMCDGKRQEFILLSDTLGVSMLVDAINHRESDGATETTVLGPFYVPAAPLLALGSDISRGLPGEPLFVAGRVTSTDGTALVGATVDVWQADSDGYYDVQRSDVDQATLRARFQTDDSGRFHFWSIMPCHYSIPHDGPVGDMLHETGRHPHRPAHIHFKVRQSGFETLVTHIFAADSRYLDGDAVFGVKSSLIGDFIREAPGHAPDGTQIATPWRKLNYNFSLKGC